MARFTHTLILDAVPRRWFGELVMALHDQLGSAEGLDLTVASWDPKVETSGEFTFADETMGLACEFALRSAELPVAFDCAGQVRLPDDKSSFLRVSSWTAHAELDRWWRITASGHNKIFQAAVRLVPVRVDSARWQVKVHTKMRGRSFARPFLAVLFLATRGMIGRQLTTGLREAEQAWHEKVPPLLRQDPADVVRAALTEATEER